MGSNLSVNDDEFTQSYQTGCLLSAQFATPIIPTRKSTMIANLSDPSKQLVSLILSGSRGQDRTADTRIFNPQLIECANFFSRFLNT